MTSPSYIPAMCESSMAWAVHRVVNDAVKDGRLSQTEAAVVFDFIWHSKMPEEFRMHKDDENAFKREVRF